MAFLSTESDDARTYHLVDGPPRRLWWLPGRRKQSSWMTEFQRAAAAVGEVEALVEQLVAEVAAGRNNCVGGGPGASKESIEPACMGFTFEFDPPVRREASATGGDWVVIGSLNTFQGQVSDEQRARFAEAELRFAELGPVAERMRRKCEARADLEAVKADLRAVLCNVGEDEDVLVAARQAVAGPSSPQGAAAETLRRLLDHAVQLDVVATYGAKMADRALDLLARLDAARALFDTDVVPRLAAAVAAAAADEAELAIFSDFESAAALEEAARHAHQAALRPAAELLAASEAKLRAQREIAEAAAAAESAQSCAAEARVAMPRLSFNMFS